MYEDKIFQLPRHQSASQEIYDPLPVLLLTCCYETLGKITSLRYASLHTSVFEVFLQNSQGHFQIFEDYIYSHWFWGQRQACFPHNAKTRHTAIWTELLDLIQFRAGLTWLQADCSGLIQFLDHFQQQRLHNLSGQSVSVVSPPHHQGSYWKFLQEAGQHAKKCKFLFRAYFWPC